MEIETVGELLYACKENRLKLYKGFGEKTQQNVIDTIEFYFKNKGSHLYAQVALIANQVESFLVKVFPGKKIAVTGSFKQFNATVETEGDDITTAKIHFTADIHSISTNNEQRDAHLRTGDFFDAENHPQLTFESNKLEKTGDENYKLYGTLTMRGVSKPVVLNVEYGGNAQDPWGNTRIGASVSGKIHRKDFGVSFSMVSETGGVLLGEEVTINANAEFIKQAKLEKQAA
jgi:polyisoprenoid-binding protein YceI